MSNHDGKITKEQLLEKVARLLGATGGEIKPAAVRELFTPEDDELPLKTETPPKMVSTLVRMKVLEAARDLDRTESLVAVFMRAYDQRMVSFNRKGRLELLGALQALAEAENRPEIPMR
jgi:hypothetical protein